MKVDAFLREIRNSRDYEGQMVHVQDIPARDAAFADPERPLTPRITEALGALGIQQLYTHQASAVDAIRRDENVVIVTSTASGKTLCYTIPVLESLADDPETRALWMFPTKALAQDQLKTLRRFVEGVPDLPVVTGAYDGDTPQTERRTLRDRGRIILTNPDMLHQAILPHHSRWAKFFSHLRYVVVDEVHAYRGVFGSHLANVMRRLERVCRHHGCDPQFVCCSATIANPVEHASRITARAMELVDDDGSPRGPKRFVLWNPPVLGLTPGPSPSQTALGRGENGNGVPPPALRAAPSLKGGVSGKGDGTDAGGERRGPIGEAIE
ncbi:MAG TPA: DEAD/DEAH box helicase, partial [Armatimonadota bacterium]|nr:DEAD/DEAH box helicase [Armatimonadota bacterium]